MIFYEMCGHKIESHPAFNGKGGGMGVTLMYQLALLNQAEEEQLYEERYPKPADVDSLEYLAWVCTRVRPSNRPSAEEILQRLTALIVKEEKRS